VVSTALLAMTGVADDMRLGLAGQRVVKFGGGDSRRADAGRQQSHQMSLHARCAAIVITPDCTGRVRLWREVAIVRTITLLPESATIVNAVQSASAALSIGGAPLLLT
jgi:hypothetical protein